MATLPVLRSIKGWKESSTRNAGIEREGVYGNDFCVDDVHKIEIRYNYNGSGKEHMNASTKWPVLDVHIAFREKGEITKR